MFEFCRASLVVMRDGEQIAKVKLSPVNFELSLDGQIQMGEVRKKIAPPPA